AARALGERTMLYGLSKQIAHCYFRATQCSERAALSVGAADREFYLEREKAWLALARSYEFQERLDRVVKERQKQRGRRWPATRILAATSCLACNVEMLFQESQPVKRVFLPIAMAAERAFFLC